MTTRRQQYRRVQSASDIYDPQRRSDSRRDGRNATQFVSPQGRRRRYGKVGSARSIRYPPAGRGVESESSNESLNVPLELAPDEEASDGFNVYGNNSYSDRMSSSMPQIRRNGWNQRKSLSSSSLGNHNNNNPDNNNNTKEEGGLEGIPWSPTKGRKDSVGNNSMSSVSLMGDSATPIQDSLTSMGSSSSTIPPGPSQLLAPGNAELRWNACGSSSHRKKFDEVPPAFQGLTPPTRPRPSVTASAESLPPPLTDDDDDTAEFAESTYDEIFDGQDDILIVDDRLPPAYQEAVRNEHRRKSTKGTPTTATKQETGSKSKIPKPENRQSDMQWDDQQQYDLAMNSPKHVKEGFSHANATELPPAFKFIISPSSGKKRVVAIASSSLLEEDGESGKRALTAADMDTNGCDETDMQPETGHYNTGYHESMDTNNHDDSPVPPKRSWKVKRLVSVESFNKKAREEEEDNHEDESSGLTASETEVNSIADQEETIAYSDSPTAAKRSWKPKRVMSVDSFNRESHVQPEEPKSTKDETEASDSPKPRTRYFKTKRVLSVDSFNKKLGESENTAAATETKSLKKQAADEEDQSGMNERPPTKKY